jgi:hypothetical protein
MGWLDRLEKKFGRFAIKRLMYYIISLNFVVFVLMLVNNNASIINILELNPSLALQGQWWRLISFIFIPPSTSPLFILFILYFYYLVGVSLEEAWGSFRFNIYYVVGMLASIAAAFIVGGSTGIYLNLSLFLAFAYLFPNYEILILFILPVKVKYLAWLYWVLLGVTVILGSLPNKIIALASVVNYLLFFGVDIFRNMNLKKQVHFNRRYFYSEIAKARPIHQCEVCGKTEKDDPRMDFAYCKECGGEYEYCSRHIANHIHK